MRFFLVTALMTRSEGFMTFNQIKKFIGACRDEADALGQATLEFQKDLPHHALNVLYANDITDDVREIMKEIDHG